MSFVHPVGWLAWTGLALALFCRRCLGKAELDGGLELHLLPICSASSSDRTVILLGDNKIDTLLRVCSLCPLKGVGKPSNEAKTLFLQVAIMRLR
jgi:hypothetical protein